MRPVPEEVDSLALAGISELRDRRFELCVSEWQSGLSRQFPTIRVTVTQAAELRQLP